MARNFYDVKVKVKIEEEEKVKWVSESCLVECDTLTEVDKAVAKVPELEGEEYKIKSATEKQYNSLLVHERELLNNLTPMQLTQLEQALSDGRLKEILENQPV